MKKFLSFVLTGAVSILTAADVNLFKKMWLEPDENTRVAIQDKMQKVIDRTTKAEFEAFDDNPQSKSSNPVLNFYDSALERLLTDIPATRVEPGTVVIWYLYNLGFVIKTPDSCFGVDLHHRNAVRFAPFLDFIVVTHNHRDHYSIPLMRRMNELNKLVISNFFPNPGYTKASEYTHQIGNITIICSEADHNYKLKKFTMPMEIICLTGDKKFVFYTSGDCGDHVFLEKRSEKIDVYAIHPRCAMDPVKAVAKLEPELTFIGHLQELGHEINRYRWPFTLGRDVFNRLQKIGRQSYIPVWGEKFIWDGRKLHGRQK